MQGAGLLSNTMYNTFDIVPKSLIIQAKACSELPSTGRFKPWKGCMGSSCECRPLQETSYWKSQNQRWNIIPPDWELIADRVCETVLVRRK